MTVRPLAGWSLRARLLVGVVGLVLVALLAFGLASVTLLRSYLQDRADDQLVHAAAVLSRRAPGPDPALRPGRRGPDPGRMAPAAGLLRSQPGSLSLQWFDPSGTAVDWVAAGYADQPDPLPAVDPAAVAAVATGATPEPFTVGAQADEGFRYRVLLVPQDSGVVVAVGVPVNRDDETVTRLLVLELVVAAVVVGAVAVGGLRVIRLGLRPLDDMTDTATAIAEGDLSHRVPVPAERRDEVGRLGRAFNTMLAHIEGAFGQRQHSEGRLRQFVADASHELRTPLTSIRGYAELHRRGMLTTPEAVDDAMRRIEDEATRMGTLVDDLLLLARLDQGRPLEAEPVDLVGVAADAVHDLQVRAEDRTVTYAHDPEVAVLGDAVRLHQVVANLLENARVHTPPGTAVHVAVHRVDDDALVRVADEGPGLAPDVAARVFERSFRGDGTGEHAGSGLGLSIVAAIAAAHGGVAWVESTPGRGTAFSVRVPVSGPPAGP
jgi:two-component system OmpR family sensor kinase